VQKKTGPGFETITCDQVDKNANLNLIFYGESHEGDLFDAFKSVVQHPELSKYNFFATTAECAISETPSLTIYRSFDKSPITYSGAATQDELLTFLKSESIPTIFEFNDDAIEPIFHQQQPTIFLLIDPTDDKEYRATFSKAAEELKSQILFCYSGVTEGIQKQLGDYIGVTTVEQLPVVIIVDPSSQSGDNVQKYLYEGAIEDLTVDGLKQFVTDFKDGKLQMDVEKHTEEL